MKKINKLKTGTKTKEREVIIIKKSAGLLSQVSDIKPVLMV